MDTRISNMRTSNLRRPTAKVLGKGEMGWNGMEWDGMGGGALIHEGQSISYRCELNG